MKALHCAPPSLKRVHNTWTCIANIFAMWHCWNIERWSSCKSLPAGVVYLSFFSHPFSIFPYIIYTFFFNQSISKQVVWFSQERKVWYNFFKKYKNKQQHHFTFYNILYNSSQAAVDYMGVSIAFIVYNWWSSVYQLFLVPLPSSTLKESTSKTFDTWPPPICTFTKSVKLLKVFKPTELPQNDLILIKYKTCL